MDEDEHDIMNPVLPFESVSCNSQEYDNVTTLHYRSSGRLRRLKSKESFKLLALIVVAVAHERWSLTRGYKYSDLTWKLLVFWKTGRWGELVAAGGSTVYMLIIACSRLSVSRDDRKSGRGIPLVPHPGSFDRPHWPRAWNSFLFTRSRSSRTHWPRAWNRLVDHC